MATTTLPSPATHFCTTKGWFAYSDLTPAVRRAILSAEDGVGYLANWVSTQTAKKLVAMGIVEDRVCGLHLTHHGQVLWCEIDEA
jgi:hypothetical protein